MKNGKFLFVKIHDQKQGKNKDCLKLHGDAEPQRPHASYRFILPHIPETQQCQVNPETFTLGKISAVDYGQGIAQNQKIRPASVKITFLCAGNNRHNHFHRQKCFQIIEENGYHFDTDYGFHRYQGQQIENRRVGQIIVSCIIGHGRKRTHFFQLVKPHHQAVFKINSHIPDSHPAQSHAQYGNHPY